ncbi:hypothetical protein DQP57_00385 [Mycobacterium colombiense]|uniref:DUF7257 domain-containing protein n=1 Tax=Mycobacterium colombiense TaxID=339268 RepID=A0A329ME27_9MYCO|nr:hypothetical protein DQP57_00385 [Mycobacterium colombiense]
MVLLKHMGLMSPFQNLDQRGARQDGATWNATVYDPGEIMLGVEASGLAPQNIRDVIRHWISAWKPRATGIFSVFTPDMGEWWCPVRLGKHISDEFTKDYTYSGRQVFTWEAINYDAFWYSVDSVSSFGANIVTNTVNFTQLPNATTLPNTFTSFITPSTDDGTQGIQNGAAVLIPTNGQVFEAQNIYNTATDTDDQIVSITFAGATLAHLFDVYDPFCYVDVWARCSSDGKNGIRLRLSMLTHEIAAFVDGAMVWEEVLINVEPPLWGETFTLIAGTSTSPYNIMALRDGFTYFNVQDNAHLSALGEDYRLTGFGMTSSIYLGLYFNPQPIAVFSMGDNTTITQSGTVPLTNIGDEDAWPRYLVYGPGTFSFSNGPGSQSMITFGPLEAGQVALVCTDPMLRTITDLTPGQPPPPTAAQQSLLTALLSFAQNNNTPPFLAQYQSVFGAVPPQGNLSALVSGRFTNPLPGAVYGIAPKEQHFNVTITNGGPTSKVVAAVTPMRRWPL